MLKKILILYQMLVTISYVWHLEEEIAWNLKVNEKQSEYQLKDELYWKGAGSYVNEQFLISWGIFSYSFTIFS
jgi:hypothetical protein